MNFLIVDDKVLITDLLTSLIEGMGFNCVAASNGAIAFELFNKEHFDIVITDLMMPEMKGEELIKKIRELNKETIIIVITGYATIDVAIEVMKEGAFDFIKKPFHIDEIKLIIKKAVDFYTIREMNRKYSEEMKIAQGLRQKLLFQPQKKIPGLVVGVETAFLEELGGDVYNIIPQDENNLIIYVGDVSNRGVNAALLFSMVHSVINELILTKSAPKDILNHLNIALNSYLGHDTSNFVALLIMQLDLRTNQLTYARAGHNTPLIRRGEELIKLPENEEVFLGMFDSVFYTERQAQLQNEDRLILYTDGLVEACNPSGKMFGLGRLERLIEENDHLSCQTLARNIIKNVTDYQQKTPLKDDITLLILEITGEKSTENIPMAETSTRILSLEIPSVLKYRKGIVSKILSLGNELGMSNDRLQDLKLIVDEAVINAIEHGNKSDRDKKVFVSCRAENDCLEMTVRDEGPGFDPATFFMAQKDELNLRGRGLMLIKQFAEQVTHNETGNEITIFYKMRSDYEA